MWEGVTSLKTTFRFPFLKFGSKSLGDNFAILLEWTHEGLLLLGCLEATVTHFGSGVDELEIDILQSGTGSLLEKRLAEGDGTLLWAHNATLKFTWLFFYSILELIEINVKKSKIVIYLDKDKVVLDETVVDETADWVD